MPSKGLEEKFSGPLSLKAREKRRKCLQSYLIGKVSEKEYFSCVYILNEK